jgi:hypothetical protein
MFDSIFLKIKCPFCGQVTERECQTKELACELKRLHIGDNIEEPGIDSLVCITSCDSPLCATPRDVWGVSISEARSFEVEIETPLGLITGKYKYLSNLL